MPIDERAFVVFMGGATIAMLSMTALLIYPFVQPR